MNCYIGTPKRTRSFYTAQTFYKTEELLVCWTYSWILVCYNLLHFDLLMTFKLFSHRIHRTTGKQLSCLRTTSKQIQLGKRVYSPNWTKADEIVFTSYAQLLTDTELASGVFLADI